MPSGFALVASNDYANHSAGFLNHSRNLSGNMPSWCAEFRRVTNCYLRT